MKLNFARQIEKLRAINFASYENFYIGDYPFRLVIAGTPKIKQNFANAFLSKTPTYMPQSDVYNGNPVDEFNFKLKNNAFIDLTEASHLLGDAERWLNERRLHWQNAGNEALAKQTEKDYLDFLKEWQEKDIGSVLPNLQEDAFNDSSIIADDGNLPKYEPSPSDKYYNDYEKLTNKQREDMPEEQKEELNEIQSKIEETSNVKTGASAMSLLQIGGIAIASIIAIALTAFFVHKALVKKGKNGLDLIKETFEGNFTKKQLKKLSDNGTLIKLSFFGKRMMICTGLFNDLQPYSPNSYRKTFINVNECKAWLGN